MDQVQQPVRQSADWNGYQPSPLSEKEPASRYILGFVGALVGAVVGCIPWFIVSTFMNYFVGVLGFVVGIASFFGYKLLKGPKKTVYAYAVVLVCSIVCILISGAVGFYVTVMNELAKSFEVSYGELMEMISLSGYTGTSFLIELCQEDAELLTSFVTNMILGLVLGVLGIVAVRKPVAAYTLSGQFAPGAQGVPVQTGFDPNAAGTMPVQAGFDPNAVNGMPVQTSPASYAPVQAEAPQQATPVEPMAAVQAHQPVETSAAPVSEPSQQELPH